MKDIEEADSYVAAVGVLGRLNPIVWGLGKTEAEAREDARSWLVKAEAEDIDEDLASLVFCEVPARVAAKINAGVSDCKKLGLSVTWGVSRVEYRPTSFWVVLEGSYYHEGRSVPLDEVIALCRKHAWTATLYDEGYENVQGWVDQKGRYRLCPDSNEL